MGCVGGVMGCVVGGHGLCRGVIIDSVICTSQNGP